MSLILRQDAARPQDDAPRNGAAFLIESMVLLVFLAASLTVLVQLYAASLGRAAQSSDLSDSIAAATEVAEHFQSDPLSVPESTTYGDFLVKCTVADEAHRHGMLYRATIKVYDLKGTAEAIGKPTYELSTSRYVSEVER